MGTDGACGLLFCAAKRSGAFPPNMPAGLAPARMIHEVSRVALAAKGLVLKHVATAEVRIVVAAVLAAAADVVLCEFFVPESFPPCARARGS
jgi:hypothetical protein